jgi:uncharacterized protein
MRSQTLYPYRTSKNWYVYDAATNEILSLSRPVWQAIQRWKSHKLECPDQYRDLLSKHVPLRVPEALDSLHTVDSYKSIISTNMEALIIGVTERCNFRCTYCVYSGNHAGFRKHGKKSLTTDIATKAVDIFLRGSLGSKRRTIAFYGGEPVLEMDTIKSVVAYVKDNAPFPVAFTITTNGHYLDDDEIDFFVANSFVSVISLDGPQQINDLYRKTMRKGSAFSGTYQTLARIRQRHPAYFANNVHLSVTLSPQNNLFETRSFFDDDPVVKDVATLLVKLVVPPSKRRISRVKQPEGNRDDMGEMQRLWISNVLAGTPRKSRFLSALFEKEFHLFHCRTLYDGYDSTIYPNGQCVPGVRRLFVDVDGKLHACERVMESIPLGDVELGISECVVIELLNRYSALSSSTCKACFANRNCYACFAQGFGPHGFFDDEKRNEICDSIRIRFAEVLQLYTEVMECNEHAFDYLKASDLI